MSTNRRKFALEAFIALAVLLPTLTFAKQQPVTKEQATVSTDYGDILLKELSLTQRGQDVIVSGAAEISVPQRMEGFGACLDVLRKGR